MSPSSRSPKPQPLIPVVRALLAAERLRYSDAYFRILVVLANYVNGGEPAFPSVPTLARRTGKSDRCVQLALRQFEADGLIAVTRGNGRGRRSHYYLLLPDVQPDLFSEEKPAERLDTQAPPPKPERVNSDSPFQGSKRVKRVNRDSPIPEKKGESGRTKRVNRDSPRISPLESPTSTHFVRSTAVAVPLTNGHDFDPGKALWGPGVAILKRLTGQTTTAAKKQIGAFLRDHANQDQTTVYRALEAAEYEGPAEPIPWIVRAIQARTRPRLGKVEQIRQDLNLGSFLTPTIDGE